MEYFESIIHPFNLMGIARGIKTERSVHNLSDSTSIKGPQVASIFYDWKAHIKTIVVNVSSIDVNHSDTLKMTYDVP